MGKRITVSDSSFLVELSNMDEGRGELNGKAFEWDVRRLSGNLFHVIKDNRSYEIEILSQDGQKTTVSINGKVYGTECADKFDELLRELGMEKGKGGKVNEMKAPMPGLVLEVIVKNGDHVLKGDTLLVLEAMKMENVIKSPADGDVTGIEIAQGDIVEKGQVMVRFS